MARGGVAERLIRGGRSLEFVVRELTVVAVAECI